ncbi:NAD-dependent DNA ligase LigA [Bacillus sp. M6-12]|uniref:NAD-dependent DNA ligase LigA n=1 Tax=Bacillus sp. M6-12 TaxID=2054166 RepID=UPI0021551A5C|nr:NAD-dependent DNA ligase LigA [Bacillus sp. M6-12]
MQPINVMNIEEAEARILFLQEEVAKHDALYEQNKPIISDSEYDKIYHELVQLELKHPTFVTSESPTQRIVTVIVDSLKKVTHTTPMLSQDKVHTAEDIIKFVKKSVSRILAQLKLDGLTIVLTYENGRRVSAVTRGDGYVGEDVLHTISTSVDVPKHIPFLGRLEIRAEAVITFEDFERINMDGEYATTRNLASGTVRQLDANVAKERNIRVVAFDLVSADGKEFENDVEQLEFMKALGFNVVPYEVFENTEEGIEALIEFCTTFSEKHRKNLPYAIDGLVLKFDDLAVREELGYTNKFPRWGCAFKFESLEATTKLQRTVNQVGKTGQITPVAEFDMVNIEGVEIRRATLHNFNNIGDKEYVVSGKTRMGKDIRIGDTIVVARANDVIPQVVQSIKELRTGNEEVIVPPAHCPACGSPTEWIGENLYCTGIDCKPQLEGKLIHFVSRKTLNIDGIGKETVKMFIEKGFISNFSDIFRLQDKEEEITSIEGFGKKSFDKMIKGIEESKKAPLHRVIYSLSIRNIGETASKDVSKVFKNMDEIIELSKNLPEFEAKVRSINDFGDTMTATMIDFFTNEKNIELIRDLQAVGFKMESEFQGAPAGTTLEGLTFVITGKFSIGRSEFKSLIESLGGKASGSVSKKTNYLLMGEGEEGSSKHQKAIELGTEILSEDTFKSKFGIEL